MEVVITNAVGTVRYTTHGGRKYAVVPMTMIVSGVLNGSRGRLYYPESEIARTANAWNHIPIVVNHPAENGVPVEARSPGVIDRFGIGEVYNVMVKGGKLRAEGWFDVERTRRVDPSILRNIEAGRPVELSTGLFTDNEPVQNGVDPKGNGYDFIAKNYRPDHLAVLPTQTGACSVRDGCGVLVNASISPDRDLGGQFAPVGSARRLFRVKRRPAAKTGSAEAAARIAEHGDAVKIKAVRNAWSDAARLAALKARKGLGRGISRLRRRVGRKIAGVKTSPKVVQPATAKPQLAKRAKPQLAKRAKPAGVKPAVPVAKRLPAVRKAVQLAKRVPPRTPAEGKVGPAKTATQKTTPPPRNKDGRFPSKHNPDVTYGHRSDRDSDDRHFDKSIKAAKDNETRIRAKLDQAEAAARDRPKHIAGLRDRKAAADAKLAEAQKKLARLRAARKTPKS